MLLSINPIFEKYNNNFYQKKSKQVQNTSFGSNKLVQNFIKSDINKGLFESNFNKGNLITTDEIKCLLLQCQNKKINLQELITEYGKENGKKLFKALRFKNNEFFIGNNPNASIENLELYYKQFKNFSEDRKLSLITRYANLRNGKYLDFWRNNPEKLLMSVNLNTYLPSQLKCFNSETWEAILDSYIAVFNNKDRANIIDSIVKYSFDGYSQKINFLPQINNLLNNLISKLENNQVTDSVFRKEMDRLYNLIIDSRIVFYDDSEKNAKFKDSIKDSCNRFEHCSSIKIVNNLRNCVQNPINEACGYNEIKNLINNLKKVSICSTQKESGIPLLRNDGISFFKSLDTACEKITDLMSKAKSGDFVSKNKVLDYFNHKLPEINRLTFLSTAIKPYEFMRTPVKWNLTLGQGVNYLYLSQIVDQIKVRAAVTEAELLIHPCKLKVNGAKYNDDVLVIDATILPLKNAAKFDF